MEKQKNSKLGVWALVLTIIGATFPIAAILAIIDLSKKDGRKKTLSVVSLIMCAFILTAVIASNISQNKNDNTSLKAGNQSQVETEVESDEDSESNNEKEKNNSVNLTSYEHKADVENYVMSFIPNADFSFKNYHEWDDGAGFIMVENTYEEKGIEHTYLVRLGKDNVVYKLSIDDQVIFKADTDTLIEYMDKYSE